MPPDQDVAQPTPAPTSGDIPKPADAPNPSPAPAPDSPTPDPAAIDAAKDFLKPAASSKAEKPEYVPADFWDADKGEVKADDLKGALDELKGLKAPRAAEDYKIDVDPALAKELGFDDGQPVFDMEAPLTKLLPGILASMGADPSKLGAAMGEVAKVLHAEQEKLRVDMVAEIGKMGENAPQRLAAMKSYIVANLPTEKADDLLHALGQSGAGALSAFEMLLNTSRGLSSPDGSGGGGKPNPDLSPTETLTQVFEQNARKGLGRRA